MLLEKRRNNIEYRKGTDVDIFRWNVDKYYDGMWDKIYCTLTGGCDDSVDSSKGWFNVYDEEDIGVCPPYWNKAGYDGIAVYQPTEETLRFVQALADKFQLPYEYFDAKTEGDQKKVCVIYVPQGASTEDYIDFEPDSYKETNSKRTYDVYLQAPTGSDERRKNIITIDQ